MRKFWPSSLYGQILAVAALALLLAQAVNTTLLVIATNGRATVEASSMLVARIANQVERQRFLTNEAANAAGRQKRAPAITVIVGDQAISPRGFTSQPELAERASEYLLAVDPQISAVRLSKGPVEGLPDGLRRVQDRRWPARLVGSSMPNRPREAVLLSMKTAEGRWANVDVILGRADTVGACSSQDRTPTEGAY
jgi:hypothetical protein